MKNLKRFISFILVFILISSSLPINAVAQDESTDEIEVPQNPPGLAVGEICKGYNENQGSGKCCVGLTPNAIGKCDAPAFSDDALKSCTSDASCLGGTGCLPQTTGSLFTNLSPSTVESNELSAQRNYFEAQLDEIDSPKPAGGICIHSRDCLSYSCNAAAGLCEDKKVCRFADVGEFALPNVKCAGELVKQADGTCDLSTDAKLPIHIGLLDKIEVKAVDGEQCRFELDEDARAKSIVAMKSLRALEWFFSTIKVEKDFDCFDVVGLLKEEIGKPLIESRKTILRNFTEVLNGIEFDYAQLINAKEKAEKEGTKELRIHLDEKISAADLSTRQTSGYDTLMMMFRRNELFQSYEQAMLDTLTKAPENQKSISEKVTGLSIGLGSWTDSASTWDIGTKKVPAFNCEGSKYKTKKHIFSSWKTKYYNKTKDRWAVQYDVSGSAENNASIVKREGVSRVLKLISGDEDEEAPINLFTQGKYYLMDPMLFSTMPYMGRSKGLKSTSSFFGLGAKFKDLRTAYYIDGNSGSYAKMHADLKKQVTDFYKKLKIDQNQKTFVYEPEIVTSSAKDCLDTNPINCEKFDPFIQDVADGAFAYFLAYSYSKTDSLKGISNADSFRRKLLAKIEVDIQNISTYYTTLISHRTEQNKCLQKVIDGLKIKDGVLDPDNDGLTEGGVYFDSTTGYNVANNALGNRSNGTLTTLSRINPGKFSFNLADSSLFKLNGNSLMDNVSSSENSSSQAGVNSSALGQLAARRDAMLKANAKAASAGIKVAAKEKAIRESIRKYGKGFSSAGGPTGHSGTSSFEFGGEFKPSAVSGDDASKNGVAGNENDIGQKVIEIGGANAGASSGTDSSRGKGPYGNTGNSASSSGENALNDGTGLSDADKEKLLSEYERNKKEYEGTDEDGIFNKVSKAYVRNLDKVLIKKKKIDP